MGELLQKREDNLIWKLVEFEKGLADFGVKYVEYMESRRAINGYDEMKAKEIEKKIKIQHQIKNEMLNISTDSEFEKYLSEIANVSYSIVMFHRSKFPPSKSFLTDCFAPLCTKFGNMKTMRFVIVHCKCNKINSFLSIYCILFLSKTIYLICR